MIVVDIVTTQQVSLHNELMDVLRLDHVFHQPAEVVLAALAYRPTHQQGQDQVEAGVVPLLVGGTMPTLPLSLQGAGPVPLDLEATYMETRQRCRL